MAGQIALPRSPADCNRIASLRQQPVHVIAAVGKQDFIARPERRVNARPAAAYFCKHPPEQMADDEAFAALEAFTRND